MRFFFCFFKQKSAYEMRISDWSSDVCSSDLGSGVAMTSTVLTVRKTLMGAIWRLLSLQSGSALRNTAVGAIAVMAIGLFGRVLSYPVQDDEDRKSTRLNSSH